MFFCFKIFLLFFRFTIFFVVFLLTRIFQCKIMEFKFKAKGGFKKSIGLKGRNVSFFKSVGAVGETFFSLLVRRDDAFFF